MSEINANRLGGLWDGETKHQAGSVWDINGLSPTIDTMLGGGREPHIMEIWNVRNIYINSREAEKLEEVKVIGNYMPSEHNASRVVDDKGIAPTVMENHGTVTGVVEIQELGGLEEGSSQRRKVFDENGVSPTLQAAMGSGGGNVPLVVDAVIGSTQENAMVGNGKYGPCLTSSMGTGGGHIPMITERTCVAMRGRNPENPSDRTPGIELEQRLEVNDTGCTNTLTTVQKDNLVLEESVVAYDEQNQTVRTETFGTLTTDGSSPKHNNRVIKIKQATKQGFVECEIGGVCNLDYVTSQTRRGRVEKNGQISPTLTTENVPNRIEFGNPDFYNFLYEINGEIYLIRIRKLIPLECWRLMGFSDEDFSKAEKVNSNTQLYKQAGNSIVCDCLEAIFSQMNITGVMPWNEKQKESV